MPDGEKLTLAFLSMEDIASLQSRHDTTHHLKPAQSHVPMPKGFQSVPWHHLDVDVTLHKARKAGAALRGWTSTPRFVDDPNLSEGIHIPRYVSRANIRALRADNGCTDESETCGQYVYDSSKGRPVLTQTSTNDMLQGR